MLMLIFINGINIYDNKISIFMPALTGSYRFRPVFTPV